MRRITTYGTLHTKKSLPLDKTITIYNSNVTITLYQIKNCPYCNYNISKYCVYVTGFPIKTLLQLSRKISENNLPKWQASICDSLWRLLLGSNWYNTMQKVSWTTSKSGANYVRVSNLHTFYSINLSHKYAATGFILITIWNITNDKPA